MRLACVTLALPKMIVQSLVVGVTKNYKIFNTVIKFVAIYMVYMLLSLKRATQMFLHNYSVFKTMTVFDIDSFVSLRRYIALPPSRVLVNKRVSITPPELVVTATKAPRFVNRTTTVINDTFVVEPSITPTGSTTKSWFSAWLPLKRLETDFTMKGHI